MIAERLYINGIVQGVGFRPFIYNLATKHSLNGWILNSSNGVEIHIEGKTEDIHIFKENVPLLAPPLSLIKSFSSISTNILNLKEFSIKESYTSSNTNIFISPDIATCRDCELEILDPTNDRFFYPFTNCTNCGPRFSIITDMPYDRKVTTMNSFNMCPSCSTEYYSKDNRRFHAQPNCCEKCGPKLSLLDNKGLDLTNNIINRNLSESINNKLIIDFTIKMLLEGNIFAIKSLSGFHLCCDAFNIKSILELRNRKHRKSKPFAIMMKSIDIVKKYCFLSNSEEELLLSIQRPIVLLKRKLGTNIPEEISKSNNYIGIMLPSTPLHIMIFSHTTITALVMTSGNLSSLPLEYDNDSALNNLSSFADFFLMHNRYINIPIDDSICKVVFENKFMLRRGRGYAPSPLYFPNYNEVLALGSNMKNTFSISKDDYIFTSSHGGDLTNYESLIRYKKNILHFIKIFNFTPKYLVCDLHPNFEYSSITNHFNIPIIKVQHHHAHIASCMVDNNYTKKVIGVAFDGTGFGDDDCIWGSEFLICDFNSYKRVAHLEYSDFIGGDNSLKDGSKIAISYISSLLNTYSDKPALISYLNNIYKDKWENIFSLINSKICTYKSSSMGRLFDGVSSLLDLCHNSTFEGEGAIILESLINMDSPSNSYGIKINTKNNMRLFSINNLITQILDDILKGTPPKEISLKFHLTIVDYIVTMCTSLKEEYSINTVALSGGVFQNTFLLETTIKSLEKLNFKVLIHKEIPTNDGGISVGQLVIAKSKF